MKPPSKADIKDFLGGIYLSEENIKRRIDEEEKETIIRGSGVTTDDIVRLKLEWKVDFDTDIMYDMAATDKSFCEQIRKVIDDSRTKQ